MDQYDKTDITKLSEAVAKRLSDNSSSVVTVFYAGELTDKIRQHIEKGIQSRFPEATTITFEHDNTVIAGFRVEYADTIIDATAREQLRASVDY